MSLRACSLAALASLLVLTPSASAQRGGNSAIAAKNGWLFNLAEGQRAAREANKPLMVVIRCEP